MRSFNSLFPKRVADTGADIANILGPIELFQIKQDTFEISDYNSFSTYEIEANFATVTRVNNIVTLIPQRDALVGGRTITITRDGVSRNITLPLNASYLTPPVITSPVNGQNGVSLRPTFEIQSLTTSVPLNLDTHNETQWEVSTDVGFQNLVFTVTTNGGNRLTTVPNIDLPANVPVYIRCRSVGVVLGVSAWSVPVSVITAGVITPQVTGLSGSVFESGRITRGFNANSSSYNGIGTHSASQWQVLSSSGTVVHTSAEVTGTQLRSYSPTLNGYNLLRGQSYFIRVRYKSNGGVWSNYSNSFPFIVALETSTSYQVCRQSATTAPIYSGVWLCHYYLPEGHPDIPTQGSYQTVNCDTPPGGDWIELPEMRGQEVIGQTTINTTICNNVTDQFEY